MPSAEERKAKNEAVFRDANEEIQAARKQLPDREGRIPVFCECDDAGCREIVRLGSEEYEAVRASPTAFLIARSHLDGASNVVAEHGDYVVVEKEGVAGAVALETDPRSESG